MFDEIQKIIAEETARIAAKGYKTAEVSVVVNANRHTWVFKSGVKEFDYGPTKYALSVDELHDKISDLPDATDAAKSSVIEEYAKLQARAAELGVSL